MTEIPLTITEAGEAIRAGKLTSLELTEACLERADYLDGRLGVFITRMTDTALAAAKQADADFAAGVDRGPLQGIPIGVKDIIATKDAPTTAQSMVLDPAWGEGQDAPVVARLREAGAVIVGKTSTMEFAIGMPDASKPFPVPRNPWNPEPWPGGSSSGSGAGVAAGLFLGALGTDTGGSVRIPAAFCGITGMKQTHGLVPKAGCAPLGYSLDHIGPMTRSARDAAAMLQVMAGYDAADATCVDVEVPDYLAALDGSVAGMRIGVERAHHTGDPRTEASAVRAFDAAVSWFEKAGAIVEEVELPYYDEMRFANTVTMRSESNSYHAMDLAVQWEAFGEHTNKAVSQGTYLSAADYVQAQRFRSFIRAKVAELMAPYDALIMLTAGCGAPRLRGLGVQSFMQWPVFSAPWNLLGLPAMATPIGFTDDGLPLSMQIVGKAFDEASVFKASDAFQRGTDHHLQLPAMVSSIMSAATA